PNQVTLQADSRNHAPKLGPAQVGYLFAHILPFPKSLLNKDNVQITLTLTFGSRKDTITLTRANRDNVFWEIFSDKYADVTSFQYVVDVQVAGPNFTDPVIEWQSPEPITVALPAGRLKYLQGPLMVS